MAWRRPDRAPFRLTGFPWQAREHVFRRLPRRPAEPLPPGVDQLADHTAGGQVSFTTNSRWLQLEAQLAGPATMDHMAATGVRGFDLYLGPPGRQRFCNVTRFNLAADSCACLLFQRPQAQWRTFTLNFPLYQGVKKMRLGLEPAAGVRPPPPFTYPGPLVFYGTSITQGGCASRPGMAYPNILGRRLNAEIINLGFSGSGRAEAVVARLMASIPNPALLVVDCDPNCVANLLDDNLPAFIAMLRAARPATPLLLLSRFRFAPDWGCPARERERRQRRDFQRRLVARARQAGDRRMYFFDGGRLLGRDGDECTVDGVHATDLGFHRMAAVLAPVIRRLLANAAS